MYKTTITHLVYVEALDRNAALYIFNRDAMQDYAFASTYIN